jgi:cytochrome c peroxidase
MKEYKVLGVPSLLDPTKVDEDRGRAMIMPGTAYERAFRVPTLRNVAKTAPYMHNGSLKTLDEVLEFYAKGGGLGRGFKLDNVDDKIRKFDLSDEEKTDLKSFLEALTDESLLPEVPKAVPSGLPVATGPLPQ